MEGKCESDRRVDEVYPVIFGNEEKIGLKLDRRRRKLVTTSSVTPNSCVLDETLRLRQRF